MSPDAGRVRVFFFLSFCQPAPSPALEFQVDQIMAPRRENRRASAANLGRLCSARR